MSDSNGRGALVVTRHRFDHRGDDPDGGVALDKMAKRADGPRRDRLFRNHDLTARAYTGQQAQDDTLPLLRVPEGYAWPTVLQISARR
jgi:hypothetical protein